ncbi:MAG TPA: exonuclease SbcCD subunit D [Pyrinomonadaceae bacterium]|jgi:DNA repair exonuclease SbcCD nuclease subunit|nr:exonuclease SbcCD subunit D [Pyrinomonadaceae bacterium]
MRFLHLADIHLGCRRYNLEERTKDFFRAWYDVINNHAIANDVDFVLIVGDFFDRRNIDPQAMNHAMAGLERLREAGIPVVAIEGNHDQRDSVSDFSWLRSLSQWGYLKLLEPTRDEEGHLELVPWDEVERAGSYVDISGARIFGSHWYGASANAAIPMLSDALRRASQEGLFNILMLHTDVEGQINRPIPALSIAKLQELKQLTGYVALGHTHKRFDVDNWAFNPGSLEATSIDEYKEERGVYLVEVDARHKVTARHLRDYMQRPFQRLSFDVSGAKDAEAVFAGVMEKVEREARTHDPDSQKPAPIIEIALRGQLGFKNSLLEINRMREEARARTGALHVIMRNQSVPVEYAVAAGMDAQAPRHERERRIIEDLIARDNRFKGRAATIAELVIEAKKQALSNESPDKILELIERKLEEEAAPLAAAKADERADAGGHAPTATALSAIERNAAAQG